MLQFPSPVSHRGSRTGPVLFVALTGAALLIHNSLQPAALNPVPPAAEALPVHYVSAPVPATPAYQPLTMEISLQESLDRMGYTVNVPDVYDGRSVLRWNAYRQSTRSDVVEAGIFETGGTLSALRIGQQSMLGPGTTLQLENNGSITDLVSASDDHNLSIGADTGQGNWSGSATKLSFWIEHPQAQNWGPDGTRPLSTDASQNPGGRAQVMVLPARTGGQWVDEGNNTGHWEGGVDSGAYILAWEDLPNGDNDFQDVIYLVNGVKPVAR